MSDMSGETAHTPAASEYPSTPETKPNEHPFANPAIHVTSAVVHEDVPGKPYALYEISFRASGDWSSRSAWRRWSECAMFAKGLEHSAKTDPRLSASPAKLPRFPASPADLVMNMMGKARFEPKFLEERRALLQQYFEKRLFNCADPCRRCAVVDADMSAN
eukprot:62419-Pleurochrysis_carterae.AAC.4